MAMVDDAQRVSTSDSVISTVNVFFIIDTKKLKSMIYLFILRIFFHAFLCVFVCIRLVTPTNVNMSIYAYTYGINELNRIGIRNSQVKYAPID